MRLIFSLFFLVLQVSYSGVMDRQNFTFNESIEINGPLYQNESRKDYNSKIFRIILEESHDLAKDYLEYGDHKAYWSFIIGSLTVPYHEGSNIHIRKTENGKSECLEKSNSGEIFKGTSYAKVFNNIFKDVKTPIIPECRDILHLNEIFQILHGYDGSDLGVMQVNIYWHIKNYLALGDYKNFRKTIRYGLKIFMRGFKGIYHNLKNYTCVYQNERINYENLIRGAWAGQYNSGQISKSCRFNLSKKKNKWWKNDKHFKESLEKILATREEKKQKRFYPLNNKLAEILKKIVENFYNQKSHDLSLANYFQQNPRVDLDTQHSLKNHENNSRQDLHNQSSLPELNRNPETHAVNNDEQQTSVTPSAPQMTQMSVTANSLYFRNGPGTAHDRCGVLPPGEIVKAQLTLPNGWIKIHVDNTILRNLLSGHTCDLEKGIYSSGKYLTSHEQMRIIAKSWVKVRVSPPEGYTMGAWTQNIVSPGDIAVVSKEIYNSENSEYPWYKIVSPYEGWVYGSDELFEKEN